MVAVTDTAPDLPFFDPDAHCVKCGIDAVTAEWKPDRRGCWSRPCQQVEPRGVNFEHIDMRCRCCGYRWVTLPLNSAPAPSREELIEMLFRANRWLANEYDLDAQALSEDIRRLPRRRTANG